MEYIGTGRDAGDSDATKSFVYQTEGEQKRKRIG